MTATEFLLLLHSVPHIGEKALARLLRLATQQRLLPEAFLSMGAVECQERFDLQEWRGIRAQSATPRW